MITRRSMLRRIAAAVVLTPALRGLLPAAERIVPVSEFDQTWTEWTIYVNKQLQVRLWFQAECVQRQGFVLPPLEVTHARV